jgi:RHS repeat-associated protein
MAYNNFGAMVGATDADANAGITGHTGCTVGTTTYTSCEAYDSTYDALPVSSANALNQTNTTAYTQNVQNGWGTWPTATTDANGQTTTYTYDPLGRMVSETLPGETSGLTSKTWTYTDWCSATGAQAPCVEVDQTERTDATHTITTRYFYDGAGRLVETRTPGPSGQDVIVYAQYDLATGWLHEKSSPYFVTAYTGAAGSAAFSLPDTTQPWTTTTYPNARTTSVTDPLSNITTTTDGVVCGVGSDSGCYTTVTTVDPVGHQTISYADGLGSAAYEQSYTGTTTATYSLYATTSYGYDANGNLVETVRPDSKTIIATYDQAGRQLTLNDPDRGNETYIYDANGNVTQTIDARGSSGTIYAGYDGLNREIWRNTANSASGAYLTYSYDSTASGNFGVGRMTSETFSNSNVGGSLSGSYSTLYSARGQVLTTTETIGGTPYSTSASYNDAGQTLTQTYPDSDILTTSYDAGSAWQNSLAVQLSGASSATTLFGSESYSGLAGAAGLLTSATLGALTGGTGAYAASYDNDGRPTNEQYTYTPTGGSAQTIYQVQPTHDALGNVIETVTTLPQGVDTQVFCYDDLSRLVWAGSTGTPSCAGAPTPSDTGSLAGTSAQYAGSYAYDSMNRLTSSPLGNYNYGDSAHADAATAIGSTWSAAYDATGNMLCRAATSATTCSGTQTGAQLSYDNEGNLTSWANAPSSPTNTDSFLYDGKGNRVEQVATNGGITTTTAYVGEVEEVSTTGSATTTIAYYDGVALSVNGALSYMLSDGLGSVSASVSSSGSVTASQLYGPYGVARYSSGTLPTSYGYTGQRADAATGLDYYNARYYDALAGQFTSADITYAGGLNRYAYVSGNPETYIDPTGYAPDDGPRLGGWKLIGWIVVKIGEAVSDLLEPGVPVIKEVPQTPPAITSTAPGTTTVTPVPQLPPPGQIPQPWQLAYPGSTSDGTATPDTEKKTPAGYSPEGVAAEQSGNSRGWVYPAGQHVPSRFPDHGGTWDPKSHYPRNGSSDSSFWARLVGAHEQILRTELQLNYDVQGWASYNSPTNHTTTFDPLFHSGAHGFTTPLTPWILTAATVIGIVLQWGSGGIGDTTWSGGIYALRPAGA